MFNNKTYTHLKLLIKVYLNQPIKHSWELRLLLRYVFFQSRVLKWSQASKLRHRISKKTFKTKRKCKVKIRPDKMSREVTFKAYKFCHLKINEKLLLKESAAIRLALFTMKNYWLIGRSTLMSLKRWKCRWLVVTSILSLRKSRKLHWQVLKKDKCIHHWIQLLPWTVKNQQPEAVLFDEMFNIISLFQ